MDEYQEIFGVPEEPEALPEGGENEREAAGPAPEEGENDQGVAAPGTEGQKAGAERSAPGGNRAAPGVRRTSVREANLESDRIHSGQVGEITGAPDGRSAPGGEEEERHRQAQLRRQREDRERQEALQQSRDKIYADIFAGQVNPFTGRAIASEADYLAWKQEKERRDAQQQRAKAEERLGRAGLPADTLRQLVRQEVESHPAVQQARQVTMTAARERAREVQRQADASIARSIQEIGKEFPEIKNLEDIAKMPTAGRFNELVQQGATLEDAFWLANRQELDQRRRAASRQAAINAARGKSHLSAGVAREAGEPVEVPADLAESYREMMPGATDGEIRAAYARYLKDIGK